MKRKHFQRILIFLVILLILSFMNACGKDKQEAQNSDKETVNKVIDKPVKQEEIAKVNEKPLAYSKVFTNGLKEVLNESSSQVDRLRSLQLDMVFEPMSKTHHKRSSSTIVTLQLHNPEASNEIYNIKTESLHNAQTGDASFVVSVGQGQEQGRQGGVYFVGNDMLLKRGSTEKKMVKVVLSPETKASYHTVSPIERLTKILSENNSREKYSEQWQTDIDNYVDLVMQSTEESNYAVKSLKVPLLSTEETCDGILLALEEKKAHTIMIELIKLLQHNHDMKGIYDGMGLEENVSAESTGLKWVQNTLKTLSADEIANLRLNFTFLQLNDKPLGIFMEATTGDKTFLFKKLFYTNNYERHHEIHLKNFDGSGVVLMDKNVSAGGNNYSGETILKSFKSSGIDDETFESHCTSIQNENTFKGDIHYTNISYDIEDGIRIPHRMSGKLNWSQEKNETNGISGTGKGELEMMQNNESNKIIMDIVLNQNYENVSISAPPFLESAGITINHGDDIYKTLDIERDEYENLSYMNKIFGSIGLLMD